VETELLISILIYFLESYHRMVWVGRDLIDHIIPTPLPWTGTRSTRPGCSEPCPAWPWTLPDVGHPQLLWAACASDWCLDKVCPGITVIYLAR